MQLTSIQLPGKQIIDIEGYEIGKIHSNYVEGNKEHTFFKVVFDDFPGSFAKISKAWKNGVDGYTIKIYFQLNQLFDILKNIKFTDDEFGEQLLMDKVSLYRAAYMMSEDSHYIIEFDNADIRVCARDFDNINTKVTTYRVIEDREGNESLEEEIIDCDYRTSIEITVSEFKMD